MCLTVPSVEALLIGFPEELQHITGLPDYDQLSKKYIMFVNRKGISGFHFPSMGQLLVLVVIEIAEKYCSSAVFQDANP